MNTSEIEFKTLSLPPRENEIIKKWNNSLNCLVSVCMITFNHAPYLRNALNSILNQKTDFPFEILIHDDASKDDSQEIIREYEKKYPNIIKPIYQKVNQYSQGISPTVHYNYPRAKSPFIAMCEGDDFWTDEKKLQTQVDLFNENPQINLCFHQAFEINLINLNTKRTIIGNYSKNDTVTPLIDILFRTRGMIPSASCMIRQKQKEELRLFIIDRPYLTLGDLFFQFFGAYESGALYIAKPMSAYRLGTEHSWTLNIIRNNSYRIRHEKAMIRAYSELDTLTNNRFTESFNLLIIQRLIWLFKPNYAAKNNLKPNLLDKTNISSNEIHDNNINSHYKKFIICQRNLLKTLDMWSKTNEQKLIYGAGSGCKLILETLGAFSIAAIIDRDQIRNGETVITVPLISEDQIKNYSKAKLLISIPSADRSKINLLAYNSGIQKDNVHYLFDTALEYLIKNPFTAEELI